MNAGREAMLTTEHLKHLNVARYEIHLRARETVVLPPFLGSTLRGAFGRALKNLVCVTAHGECRRCLLVERCVYPRLFETSALKERNLSCKDQPPLCSSEMQRAAKNTLTSPTNNNGGGISPIQTIGMPSPPAVRLLAKDGDAPRPFVFIPPSPAVNNGFLRARDDLLRFRVRVQAGDLIGFGFTLFGEAIPELPYVIYAIKLMAKHGFGAARSPFELEKVFALNTQGKRKLIYHRDDERITKHDDCLYSLASLTEIRLAQLALNSVAADSKAIGIGADNEQILGTHNSVLSIEQPIGNRQSAIGNELTLRFLTPTRLRIKGRVVEHPTFTQLVSITSLRLAMLAETWAAAPLVYDYKTMIERASEVSTRQSTLRLMSLDRFSNRRHGKLQIDGFMGDVTFSGPALHELLPLIVAGEFLHVGSGTAFGLGRYVICQQEI